MAYKSKIITNPIFGQHIEFLQTAKDTDGKLLEMEVSYRIQRNRHHIIIPTRRKIL
jgi:hypothetical protein